MGTSIHTQASIYLSNALDVDLLVGLLVLHHVHRLQVRVRDQARLEGLVPLFFLLIRVSLMVDVKSSVSAVEGG